MPAVLLHAPCSGKDSAGAKRGNCPATAQANKRSPVSGLGSKMGIDATNKWPSESSREWGRTMQMTPEVTAKVDLIWQSLGL